MLIGIDAGHGLKTAGKRCLKSIDPKQTREWVLNSRVADKLEKLLQDAGYKTTRLDDRSGNIDVSLSNRVKSANAVNCDLFISIHHNAGINGRNGGGLVVFYCSSKPEREKQAQRLYNAIVTQTKLYGNRAQKVIKKGFYVIKKTKMPAFLCELGFMDSTTDTPQILTDDFATKSALGIFNFIKDYKKGV